MPLLLDTSCTKSGISFKNVQLKMRFCFLILMSSLTFSLRTLFLKLALTPLGFFNINGNSSLSVLMVGQYSWEKLHLMPFEVLSCPVIFEDVLCSLGLCVLFQHWQQRVLLCTKIVSLVLWLQFECSTPKWLHFLQFSCGSLVLPTLNYLNLLLLETWFRHMSITFSSWNSCIYLASSVSHFRLKKIC